MRFNVEVDVFQDGKKDPAYTVATDQDGGLTAKDLLLHLRTTLIATAFEMLRDEISKGFDQNPVVVVDNRAGKPVSQAQSSIEFNSRVSMRDIILDTYEGLSILSPVRTGRYISSNFVYLNNQRVATDLTSLDAWINSNPEFKDSDVIKFINIQPYARKLERLGVTNANMKTRTQKSKDKRGRSGDRILAPNGTYYQTAKAIIRKYKRNSSVKFSFIPGDRLGLVQHKFKTKASGARNGARSKFNRFNKHQARTYLYPMITIRVKESGIL